jgi:hypothetical protein
MGGAPVLVVASLLLRWHGVASRAAPSGSCQRIDAGPDFATAVADARVSDHVQICLEGGDRCAGDARQCESCRVACTSPRVRQMRKRQSRTQKHL